MVARTIACVGGVVVDRGGRFLLVRRGREPSKGSWSIPGGKVEPGESDREAVAREVLEETGLAVVVGELVGYVERPAPGGDVFAIRDFACLPASYADAADVRAGDDADDLGWFTVDELRALDTAPGLVAAL
ncbi:MAG TPA: NUDIX domain-containing protein, partial [Nocardioides sp.]|uniref:NUDIX hydrolase n=1 Tax=Nocardioides sp. TaxID=35761 RepID=UPI002D7E7E70